MKKKKIIKKLSRRSRFEINKKKNEIPRYGSRDVCDSYEICGSLSALAGRRFTNNRHFSSLLFLFELLMEWPFFSERFAGAVFFLFF